MTRTWLVLLGSIVLALVLRAEPAVAAGASTLLDAVQAPHALAPDPALTDPAWASGAVSAGSPFTDLTTRGPAPLGTTAYVLYDASQIYVAFHCEQKGVPLAATQTANDVGFGIDDFVGIGIDPSGNGSQVYYFETTPRGVRYQQALESSRYRPLWNASASANGDGWNAVLTIPLHALRIHPGSPQNWRINLVRNVAARGEHYTYAFDGVMVDGAIATQWPTFNDVRFWPKLRNVKISGSAATAVARPHAEIYGLSSSGLDRNEFAQANGAFAPQPARPLGVDLTYPITNTINFVGTLAPDFSNVEVDQQTIAPQEFQRALQEYRPFFAQGANFINPNVMQFFTLVSPGYLVFYSPSVGPFDRGEKIEGAFGLQSFGALNFRGFDETTGNTVDDLAFGYKHMLPDRTFMYWADGVLAHHSLIGDDSTVEGGVAGRNLSTGLVYGVNEAVEQNDFAFGPNNAHAANGFLDVHKPNYEVNVGYADISPDYNPIDGFTATSDLRGPSTYVNFVGSTPFVKTYQVFMGGDRFLDRSGAVHEADAVFTVTAALKNGFSLNNVGPQFSSLRSYLVGGVDCAPSASEFRSYFSGYPCYAGGSNDRFNLLGGGLGYGDGTPSPIDVGFNEGTFGGAATHIYTSSTSRQLSRRYSLGLEYDGTFERDLITSAPNSQWLRRVSLGIAFGADSNASIGLRQISGTGGFALPGTNLAASYHLRLRSGDELFLNYGTPAATATLNRWIVKFTKHIGGGTGT